MLVSRVILALLGSKVILVLKVVLVQKVTKGLLARQALPAYKV